MKYCTNCGNPVDENAVICVKCGRATANLNNHSTKNEKKSGIYWIISLVSSILGIVGIVACFLFPGFIIFAIPATIVGIIFGVLGFFQKNRFNLIGFILGIVAFLMIAFILIVGFLVHLTDSDVQGTWYLDDNSIFEINEKESICYWRFDDDYYEGTCNYGKASNSDEDVPDSDENTFVLYMKINKIKYDGTIYEANEYLELEDPYFVFYLYFEEADANAVFYNPTSNSRRYGYKKEEGI